MLIIFGGLPGSGKSSISRHLAEKLGAVYLRIDSIETAINNSALNVKQAEDAGYLAAYDVAKDNLALGLTVIADSVNPVEVSRAGWRNVAVSQNTKFLEIEVFCSDQKEHKRRVDARNLDIQDTTPNVPWEEVIEREYDNWDSPDLRLDTFKMSIKDCVENIYSHLKKSEDEQ